MTNDDQKEVETGATHGSFRPRNVSPWSCTPQRCLRGCASAKLTAGPRVAHRVPKASFEGVLWPLLTALCRETIEKTLCGSLLLRIKSPLLYQLS